MGGIIDNIQRMNKLKEKEYKSVLGVDKNIFDEMLKILNDNYHKKHLRGGTPPKLSVLDKLIIMLTYYREYPSMQHIAFNYGVAKSTIHDSITWVEQTLIKSGKFNLPSKRKLASDTKIEVILVDATEIEIERPKKTKKKIFWQEKETHNKGSNRSRYKKSQNYMYIFM